MTATLSQDLSKERELLNFVYAAFNRRDIEPILARMQPDVQWPNGMEGGWVHGREGVREYWTRQWSMIDPRVEPISFEAEPDGRIAVNVHQLVRSPDGTILLDRTVHHVYDIHDGLIQRMEIRD